MAARGGLGITIDLDKVPKREANLSPYEILLSESQERMLIVARAGAEAEVMEIFSKWDLDAVTIGTVTDDGMLRVSAAGQDVVHLPIEPLAHGAPVYERPFAPPANLEELQHLDIGQLPLPSDYSGLLLRLLDSPNIASKRWAFRQYDWMVGSNTVVGPGSDAAVLRVKGTNKALALSVDCNSRYCLLDPYVGAMTAVVEAARNVVCSGGEPLGVTDCLNFGNPEKPEIMWQFREAVRGIRDACTVLGVPVVSGNVSFYKTDGRPIPPTPTVALVGLLSDVSPQTTQWFKGEGDVIVLLGRTREELGGSEYPRRRARSGARHAGRGSLGGDAGTAEQHAGDPRRPGAVGARRLGRWLGSGAGRSLYLRSRRGARRRDRNGSGDPPRCLAVRREPVAHRRLGAEEARQSPARPGACRGRSADRPGRGARASAAHRQPHRRQRVRAASRLDGRAAAPHGGVSPACRPASLTRLRRTTCRGLPLL
jgi:selenophosphate synthetase-related protein